MLKLSASVLFGKAMLTHWKAPSMMAGLFLPLVSAYGGCGSSNSMARHALKD